MCKVCGGYTTVNPTKAAEEAAKIQVAGALGGMGLAAIGNILGTVKSDDTTSTTQTTGSSAPKKAKQEKPEDPKEIEQNVKQLIGEAKFNELSDEFKSEILKKYSTIKTYSANNNINISDTEMTRRLTNYIKALEAHSKELKMGEYFVNGGTADGYTGENIVDEDIRQQKATGTDDEYIQSILNRGIGSVQLYDTDGDNLVSKEEFLAGEAADWKKLTGEELSDEMKTATEEYFARIDRNNDTTLDCVELGTHQYARATLGDTDRNSNEELTFTEWYLGSEVGSNEKITNRYDYASDQIYTQLEAFAKKKPEQSE